MKPFSQVRASALKENDLQVSKQSNNMEAFTEAKSPQPQRQTVRASAYSAQIQEAMRYDRLRSSEYPLVMSILDAVLEGYTEEAWQNKQQRVVKVLRQQLPEAGTTHADETDRYAQIVSRLKDFSLWPW
jgi:hypothetical protein